MTKREYIKYQGIKFYFHPYHKDYLASRCGKILSLKWNKKRILKLHSNCWGYLVFNFYKNNKKKNILYIDLYLKLLRERFQKECIQIMSTTTKKII